MIKNTVIYLILLISICYSQNIREFKTDLASQDSVVSENIERIIDLGGAWQYRIEEKENFSSVNIPFLASHVEKIELEKKFKIPENLNSSNYILVFDGITGLNSVLINNNKLNFDNFEFGRVRLNIPGRLLRIKENNILKIVLSAAQEFSYYNHLSADILRAGREIGIYGKVFIISVPEFHLSNVHLEYNNKVEGIGIPKIKFEITSNTESNPELKELVSLNINIINNSTRSNIFTQNINYEITSGSTNKYTVSLPIGNLELWSPQSPVLYKITLSLSKDGVEKDRFTKITGFRYFYSKDNKFYLNGQLFKIKGVTYFDNNGVNNSHFYPDEFLRDIRLIKSLGANSVYFLNSVPSQEFLDYCNQYGLLIFIEFDNRIYPNNLLGNSRFRFNQKSRLITINELIRNEVSVVAIGLGNLMSDESGNYLDYLADELNKINPELLSFITTEKKVLFQKNKFSFIGLNLLGKDTTYAQDLIEFYQNNNLHYFISAVGFNNTFGDNNGFSDPYSSQAQAKYLIDFLNKFEIISPNYFIHSFADYRLNYKSVIAGPVDNSLLGYGLLNEYRDQKKNSFYVVKSFFMNDKLPVINQGSYSNKSIIIFIIFGIAAIFFFVILINSTRRFREYAIRALFRTYNFFSDIRDQRVFSFFQTTLLGFIISGSISLIYSSYLFYLKDKIFFEQVISSFDSKLLLEIIGFIAWHPVYSLIILTAFFFIKIFIISVLIRFFNLFVKNKIYFSHGFIVAVWAMLPFVISLPLGVVLNKILLYEQYNLVIHLLVFLFHLWAILRLFKGISIIYDIRPRRIYLFASGFIFVFLAAFVFYFETFHSTFSYLFYFFNL